MEQGLPSTVLIVEDEIMVAVDLADYLTEAGYRVIGPINNLVDALRVGAAEKFDAALLDANLQGQTVEELATVLSRRNIPFAFVTGYGREMLPPAFQHMPLVAKPYAHPQLREVLDILLYNNHAGPSQRLPSA